jgi:superfamily II DNA or RNA helicase
MERETYDAWTGGARTVLGVLPTGGGKSVYLNNIVQREHSAGAVTAEVAHRTELVSQLSSHVASRGIFHRIIAPKDVVSGIVAEHRELYGRSFVNPDANAAVAAIDTLLARASQLQSWCEQVDLVCGDEGHHWLKSNKWGRGFGMFRNAKGLLVTASPSRTDGMGLGSHHDGLADHMVIGPNMRQLIDMGALCDYELVCPTSDLEAGPDDFNKEGELSPKRGRVLSKKSRIVGDIVSRYLQFGYGKRTIVFVTDVETAGEVAAKFNAFGITAAAVNGETDRAVRREYIKRFRDGRLTVLVNVDLFGEGFDVPACECVIMARPTGSLAVYLQQFGRALRLMLGKLYGLIIDMVGNFKRHGYPDKFHAWSLDRRDKKAKVIPDPELIDLTGCRHCSKPYERVLPACPWCGMEPPAPVGGARTLDVVDGDMTLLDRETLAAMRAAAMLEEPSAVGGRVAAVAGGAAGQSIANKQVARIQAQQRLEAVFNQYAGVQRSKGRSDRETHKRIYMTLGCSVLEAMAQPREDMERLAATVEGWYR